MAALLLSGALGCPGRGDLGGGGVNDSTFVNTIVELRRIGADSSLDSTARDSARRALLRRRGLTARQLEDAARAMAANPDRAIAIWRAIDDHINDAKRPAAKRTTPPPMRSPK